MPSRLWSKYLPRHQLMCQSYLPAARLVWVLANRRSRAQSTNHRTGEVGRRTDEAENNEPDLDISAEVERRTARLAAILAAKSRPEERQRQSDTQRGRTPDDERKPKDKNGKPKGGKACQRDFAAPRALCAPLRGILLFTRLVFRGEPSPWCASQAR